MPRPPRWILLPVFAVVAALLYGAALDSYFVADDFSMLGVVQRHGPFAHAGFEFFRPLVLLSLWLELQLWGLHPTGYHVTNVLLHAANATLVASVARAAFRRFGVGTGRVDLLAGFAGLFYLAQDCHGEPVCWISCRPDLTSTLFALLSLRALQGFEAGGGGRRLLAALGAFALALCCKESVVTLPVVVAVWLWLAALMPGAVRRPARLLGVPLAFCAVAAGYWGLRTLVLGELVGGYGDVHVDLEPPRMVRNLVLFSSRTLFPPLTLPRLYVALGVALLVVPALLLVTRRKDGVLARERKGIAVLGSLLLLGFLLTLLPVVNLWAFGRDTQGERWVYLPSVFAAIGMALFLHRVLAARRVLLAGMALAVTVHGYYALQTALLWRRAAALNRQAVADYGEIVGAEHGRVGRVFLLSLPDSLDGVYMLRNGLNFLDEFCFGRRVARHVFGLTRVWLQHPDDRVRVDVKRNTARVATRCRIANYRHPGVRSSIRKAGLAFHFIPDLGPRDLLLYFHAGHFHRVER